MTRDELSARYYAARIEADRKAARLQLTLLAVYTVVSVAVMVGVSL